MIPAGSTAPFVPSRPPRSGITPEERRVILASSLGTVFEWYDFYLYGSLAAVISRRFFAGVDERMAFILALLAFATGFAVRPFGALVFGRLGDMAGRKHTFLLTILLMGLSTALVGALPTYATIGVASPIALVCLRLLQGLALGGEYGGAATYVAEHAPPDRRGAFTSWIQTTATLGLFLSLLVIVGSRAALGDEAFEAWGWRVPFLLSVALLAVSVYIRIRLGESPVFRRMKEQGAASTAPITESFLRWGNLKVVMLVLFGAVAGQAVVWYTGQFYALFFLQQTLKVEGTTASWLVAGALLLGTPFFLLFGALSDRLGRKRLVMAGCALAALTYFPIFRGLTRFANPALEHAQRAAPITVVADPAACGLHLDPLGKARPSRSCDVAKRFLASRGLPYRNEEAVPGSQVLVKVGGVVLPAPSGEGLAPADLEGRLAAFHEALERAVAEAGYPARADPARVNHVAVILLLTLLVIYVAMVYAPMAAWLVELFPARIRYTSLSLPYHLGNGWFGGFLPTVSFAIVAATGGIYDGLLYPILVALGTAVVGMVFLPETKDRDIHHEA